MPSSSDNIPSCCICFEIYDQEMAKAFTASCGHSICAQCECKLRIACIKKGISPQCWICMKPFTDPLYRTYELESKTPRKDKPRFPNPYMTDYEIRRELVLNPEAYSDITLPNYTPSDPAPSTIPPPVQPPLGLGPSSVPDTSLAFQYSYFPSNRHHPYRPPMMNSRMNCYPSQASSYSANPANNPVTAQRYFPPSFLASIPPHLLSSHLQQPPPPQPVPPPQYRPSQQMMQPSPSPGQYRPHQPLQQQQLTRPPSQYPQAYLQQQITPYLPPISSPQQPYQYQQQYQNSGNSSSQSAAAALSSSQNAEAAAAQLSQYISNQYWSSSNNNNNNSNNLYPST